jgi:nitrate/nitrite transporter NarK
MEAGRPGPPPLFSPPAQHLAALLLASVYGLSMVMAGWLAALIVGAILAVVATALLTSSGKKLKSVDPIPNKTLQSLEENVQWAKHPVK